MLGQRIGVPGGTFRVPLERRHLMGRYAVIEGRCERHALPRVVEVVCIDVVDAAQHPIVGPPFRGYREASPNM